MKTSDPTQSSVEVLAREHMKELRAKYCWYVSRGDYERIAELYTPDGVFDFELQGKRHALTGTQGIIEGLRTRIEAGAIFPKVYNHVLFVLSPTEGIGTCAMEAHTTRADRPPFGGYYHDRFRVYEGKWLFSERRFFRYWPDFERSGLDLDGSPESGLSAQRP
jgi:hypothetical protein